MVTGGSLPWVYSRAQLSMPRNLIQPEESWKSEKVRISQPLNVYSVWKLIANEAKQEQTYSLSCMRGCWALASQFVVATSEYSRSRQTPLLYMSDIKRGWHYILLIVVLCLADGLIMFRHKAGAARHQQTSRPCLHLQQSAEVNSQMSRPEQRHSLLQWW